MHFLRRLIADSFHLFYPHLCTACASDLLEKDHLLCLECIRDLPHTNFALLENNYVENIFRGRMHVFSAHSEFYFSKGQIVQLLIHELKYKANKAIGRYLGNVMAKSLLQSARFRDIDCLVPLPLYADKELKRGYNQSAIICEGIMDAMGIPAPPGVVIRQRATETQTRKHRDARWQNVQGSFVVTNPDLLQGKKILLVDDVITTGASIEACGQAILGIPGTRLSIATLAHATK